MIDRYLAARRIGQNEVAGVYANAAEGLLTAALPAHSNAIAKVASRKGKGRSIGSALAQRLSPMTAAAVFVVWSCRQARRPAVDALAEAFRDDPVFNDTIRKLCARVIPPPCTPNNDAVGPAAPFETAASYRR